MGVGSEVRMSALTEHGYKVVPEMLDVDRCELAFKALMMQMVRQPHQDTQCPLSHAEYGAPVAEALLAILHPVMEQETGLTLLPTYSYSRIYRAGEVLTRHKDRPSCEISCTLHLGRIGVETPWPIYMEGAEVLQDIGDAVIYKGCDVLHWRDEWEAPPKAMYGQVFLHYVDANGPHAEWQFDGRPSLGVTK